MLYQTISGLEKPVSRLFYGTAMAPFLNGENCDQLLDSILETGINAIDCARVYGQAEDVLGHWFSARNVREKIVLLTKGAHFNPETGEERVRRDCILEDWNISSEKLKTNYFDIYLLHRDDPSVPVAEIMETMNELYQAGKIRVFGVSNWTHERIAEANRYAAAHDLVPFTISSPNFGLAEQVKDLWGHGCVTLTGAAQADARDWYRNNQMPVIAYSSMARGLFSGRIDTSDIHSMETVLDDVGMIGYGYPENFERLRRAEELAAKKSCTVAQIALAWMYQQGLNVFAVVSTTSADRMKQNIAALEIPLTQAECRYLNLEDAAVSF